LAPPTATSPDNRLPPVTRKRSVTANSLVEWVRDSDPLSRYGWHSWQCI
jgi:hypothetical protein